MKKLMEFKKKHADKKLFLLRLVMGAIFLAHGTAKFKGWSAPAEGLMPWIMRILSIVEPLAGLVLVLGLFVPIASMVVAVIMVGAIYAKITQFGAPFAGGWSYDLLILASALVLASHGGGAYSLDKKMMAKKSMPKEPMNQPPAQQPPMSNDQSM